MTDGMTEKRGRRLRYVWAGTAVALYAAAFLLYAEKWAFSFDESFHLLAAQLIGAGKRPYLDFCFPQAPLNAYWNAGWMRLMGESWRVPHAFAAWFTMGAVALTARFVWVRFPVAGWRAAAAATAAMLTGLNAMVFVYGPLAQAYGICLFMVTAAFTVATRGVDRKGPWWAGATGLLAGTAAASSLLTAAAAPVLLGWMMFQHRAGSRARSRAAKLGAFCAGTAIPFAPVMWLAWQGPRQAWFNLVQYHVFFRKLYWPETTQHDLEILTSWIDSGQALLLGLLAVYGLVFVARRSEWPGAIKAEFYLCAWLAGALAVESGIAHPTFARYFLLAVPFLAILGAAGLYGLARRLLEGARPARAVWPVALFLILGLGKSLYDRSDIDGWSSYERLARKIDEVTPRSALLFANEPIYVLTRRTPPPGLELSYSHKVDLGPAQNRLMHILPEAELKRQVQSGRFATASSCDEDEMKDLGLEGLYRQRVNLEQCSIFWDLKR
jgi:4-amino-4-deoxy-L-arabinose transferase-like glycosyltransferase